MKNHCDTVLSTRLTSFDSKKLSEQFQKHQMLVIEDFLPREFVETHYQPEVKH